MSVYSYSRTTDNEAAYEQYQQLQYNKRSKTKMAILLKRRRSRSRDWHYRGPRCVTQPINLQYEHAYSTFVHGWPRPLRPTRSRLPLPLACLPLPLVAQRTGEKRMCSPVPANAASLRETGSVARYTPRGLAATQCVLSMLSLMAPRVCTLVLSSYIV